MRAPHQGPSILKLSGSTERVHASYAPLYFLGEWAADQVLRGPPRLGEALEENLGARVGNVKAAVLKCSAHDRAVSQCRGGRSQLLSRTSPGGWGGPEMATR